MTRTRKITAGTLIGLATLVVAVTTPEIRRALHLDPPTKEEPIDQRLATQNGEFSLFELGEMEVFYPQKFRHPPNLTFGEGALNPDRFRIVEQRADGFKISADYAVSVGTVIRWKASGPLNEPGS